MKLFRIRDWQKHFENNRTRELKFMEWVPIPNKHDGDGYTELMDHPRGMMHYAAWLLMVQVASKCSPRGTLSRDVAPSCGNPAPSCGNVRSAHTPSSLARITRADQKSFEEAIPRLLMIGWLEELVTSQEDAENPAPSCGNPAPSCGKVPTEGNGTEGNGTEYIHTARDGIRSMPPLTLEQALQMAGTRGLTNEVVQKTWEGLDSLDWREPPSYGGASCETINRFFHICKSKQDYARNNPAIARNGAKVKPEANQTQEVIKLKEI